jgi:multiple sugar transport system substrate-binding protein
MTLFTLCANLGNPFADRPSDADPVDRATFAGSLELMRRLLAFAPASCLDWNSIDLHEAMAERDDLVFCPAVYCYATYAEADRARPLRFHDLPGPAGHRGSTIGGTGLGISVHCPHPEAALVYTRHLALQSTQNAFARHHGQPAHAGCWDDPDIDARFAGTFAATRPTIEAAWVRPRYHGYLRFQAEGGDLVEAHLRGAMTETALFDALCRSWRSSAAD